MGTIFTHRFANMTLFSILIFVLINWIFDILYFKVTALYIFTNTEWLKKSTFDIMPRDFQQGVKEKSSRQIDNFEHRTARIETENDS